MATKQKRANALARECFHRASRIYWLMRSEAEARERAPLVRQPSYDAWLLRARFREQCWYQRGVRLSRVAGDTTLAARVRASEPVYA